MCCVITADCESPVNFDNSLPSYSDTDTDELDFAGLPLKHSTVSIGQHQSALGADAEADATFSSVCAPILVVPSSESFISLMRTPNNLPDRLQISPSQARCFLFVHCVLNACFVQIMVIICFISYNSSICLHAHALL